jgi:hypothetical protein
VGDWKEQLAAIASSMIPAELIASSVDHLALFDVRGSKHPPDNELSVSETLKKFCQDFLSRSPIVDPRRKPIHIIKTNFPKLAGLKHRTKSREELPASQILAAIESGTFDLKDYNPDRDDRLRTLFWLPELFSDPDAIYPNGHKIVEGDEVYIRVYDKMGATVKVAFTKDLRDKRGRIIRTIPITSFLTYPTRAKSFVKGDPLYMRPT